MPWQRSQILYLAVSAVVHATLFLGLKIRPKTNPQPKPIIQVELLERPIQQPLKGTRRQLKGQSPRVTLRSLTPKFEFKPADLAHSGPEHFADEAASDDDEKGLRWGTGGGQFKKIEDFSLFNQIYQTTDNLLFYPAVLARNGIQGTVNARLLIDQGGQCDWSRSTISSTESHLRVYILQVLKKVCRQNYNRYLKKDATITPVDLSFTFAITEHNESDLIRQQKMIVGNVLLLYRNSQHSVAEWKIGPFGGLFPIPIVGLDFVWLVEHWEQIVEPNKPDPIDEFKER